MPVNTRTEYAIRALLEMIESDNEPVSVRQISDTQHLPRKYVEHLLANLKAAGLIESVTGSKGGYVLKLDPLMIKLYDVVKAVDYASWNMRCGNRNQEYCIGTECRLHGFWDEVSDQVDKLLMNYSLSDISHQVSAREVADG